MNKLEYYKEHECILNSFSKNIEDKNYSIKLIVSILNNRNNIETYEPIGLIKELMKYKENNNKNDFYGSLKKIIDKIDKNEIFYETIKSFFDKLEKKEIKEDVKTLIERLNSNEEANIPSWADFYNNFFKYIENRIDDKQIRKELLKTYNYEYDKDYDPDSFIPGEKYFKLDIHEKLHGIPSNYPLNTIVEIRLQGIVDKKTKRIIRKAVVVTSIN